MAVFGLYFIGFLLWLCIGILAARYINSSAYGGSPLETMVLPLRLVVILTAPVVILIYERHLFFNKSTPEEEL